MMNARYEQTQVARWMLALDAVASLVMVVSMVLIAMTAYEAGHAANEGVHAASRNALWRVMTYLSLALVSLGWMVPRYFKDRLKVF